MKLVYGSVALAIGVALAVGAVAQTPSPAPSTDSLIARHATARGGLPALRAIHTLTMTGTMRQDGFDAPFGFRELLARPGEARIELTLQGLTIVQAYDGNAGWQIQPFQGRKDAEDLSTDDAKSLAEEADFEDALIDAKAKGSTVESLGAIDVDGAPAWALRVSLKNGDQLTYYLDPDAMLTVRLVTRQVVRGAEVFTQTDYGDYEQVAGVWLPFELASGPRGSSQKQRVTYAKVVANDPVDGAIFARPASPAPTPPPAHPESH